MGRGGQETDIRRMAAIDVRMRHAAEDREVIAVFLEQLEVRRRRVIASAAGREEMVGQQAEVVADGEHPARLRAGRQRRGRRRGLREWRQHRVEKRQCKGDSRPAQEAATRDGVSRQDEGSLQCLSGGFLVHWLWYSYGDSKLALTRSKGTRKIRVWRGRYLLRNRSLWMSPFTSDAHAVVA